MHASDDFLWGGLRQRLENTGRVRPRTIRLDVHGQVADKVHSQVYFHQVRPALNQHIQSVRVQGR
jgi:hypothetical protein